MMPLLSSDFVARGLEAHAQRLTSAAALDARVARLRRVCARALRELGPASGASAVATRLAVPLARALGYRVERERIDERGTWWYRATVQDGDRSLPLAVFPLGVNPVTEWRRLVRAALESRARFVLATNGRRWLLADAARAWSRVAHVIDLERAVAERIEALSLAIVTGAPAVLAAGSSRGVIDTLVAASDTHRVSTCRVLDAGVRVALATLASGLERACPARHGEPPIAEQALTLVYRILFLLYVEATGLAPLWHPVFRAHYSMAAAVAQAERSRAPRGLWAMLQAMARLAERGCDTGTLRVTAYDSHLFAAASAPCAERARLDAGKVAAALRALSTHRPKGAARTIRFDYADLGVEQLGGIYERVLEEWPVTLRHPSPRPLSSVRKSTSSFYTPAAITRFLVRRTLAPLVHQRTSDEILALRVLDPAMGSGAFLVGACRHLALAYEAALVAEDRLRAGDLSEADRAGFRRLVAQRCLFGVDLNPRAVELARLSLWLTTLSGDRPLTFLDHRLRCGHSLLGARLADLHRSPAPGRVVPHETPALPWDSVEAGLPRLLHVRDDLARRPEHTAADIADKQTRLAALHGAEGPLAAWRDLADAWVAAWFWTARSAAPAGATYHAFGDWRLGRNRRLPAATLESVRAGASTLAGALRFFHWDLEFPEAFFDGDGAWQARPGFDAVLGNPPWDMLRRDDTGTEALAPPAAVVRHARESGRYPHCRQGHANQYQLFVDRALDLVAPGGRIGFVVPWGLFADTGSAALRETLLTRNEVDGLVMFDNRQGLFPIHRSVRFAVVTARCAPAEPDPTAGPAARLVPAHLGLSSTAALDGVPDVGSADPAMWPLRLSVGWLARVSGPDLAVPDVRTAVGAALLERLAREHPRLGDADGYGARFGRELNATDDRGLFNTNGHGWPVVEGKDIQPFVADVSRSRQSVDPVRLHGRPRLVDRARRGRLAYRDVASSTNQLTLIAAVLPPSTLSTHTLFCLDTAWRGGTDHTWMLCALLNSLLANYLVRRRVSTHVTTTIVESLTLPWLDPGTLARAHLESLARGLADGARARTASIFERDDYVALQAAVLRLACLSPAETSCVLDDFPLVPGVTRQAIRRLVS